tara:strand:+ start:77 stop:661 length:585 start_codon:yes stop_codon:yes gene_type:complete
MIRKICERCGANGESLHIMGHVYWVEEEQLHGLYDIVGDYDWYCDTCDCEADVEEVNLEYEVEIVKTIDGNTFDTEPFEKNPDKIKKLIDELDDTVDKTKPVLYNVFVKVSPSSEPYIEDGEDEDGFTKYKKEGRSDFDIKFSMYFHDYDKAKEYEEAISKTPLQKTYDVYDNNINCSGIDMKKYWEEQMKKNE